MGWRYLIVAKMGSGRVVSHPIVNDACLTRLTAGLSEQEYIKTTVAPADRVVDAVGRLERLHYFVVGAP